MKAENEGRKEEVMMNQNLLLNSPEIKDFEI